MGLEPESAVLEPESAVFENFRLWQPKKLDIKKCKKIVAPP